MSATTSSASLPTGASTPLTSVTNKSTLTPSISATPKPIPYRQPGEIECWGHRGASAHLPENTLASFRAAIAEGAQGIESDVHATSDGVVLMFHDPTLERTTDGKGLIRLQPWEGVIEHVRTTAEPRQPIPRFEELVALLMEPEHHHVSLNIDCKMQNDPEKLFPKMSEVISHYDNWETLLAPRLILGLWHPLFLKAAYKHLPKLRRYHIGFSLYIVKKYFWTACHGFSINFAILMSKEGQDFIRECRAAGKEVCVWTLNHPEEMKVAMKWGIKAILTDKVSVMTNLTAEIVKDPSKLDLTGVSKYTFPWSHWRYYSIAHVCANWLAPIWLSAHGCLPRDPSSDTWLQLELPSPISDDTLNRLPSTFLAGA